MSIPAELTGQHPLQLALGSCQLPVLVRANRHEEAQDGPVGSSLPYSLRNTLAGESGLMVSANTKGGALHDSLLLRLAWRELNFLQSLFSQEKGRLPDVVRYLEDQAVFTMP